MRLNKCTRTFPLGCSNSIYFSFNFNSSCDNTVVSFKSFHISLCVCVCLQLKIRPHSDGVCIWLRWVWTLWRVWMSVLDSRFWSLAAQGVRRCVCHINLNKLISRACFMHMRVSLYVFVLQVCVAWPACQFPARRVGLQSSVQLNLRVKPGGHVTLEPITGALLPAEHIRLSLTYSPHHLFSITYSIGWSNTQISNLIFFTALNCSLFKGELKILPWITFILSR